ncbi:fibronectin type III domain-containing protein [Ruficoccus amylovorans]|uniref:Fibronectin type III domain-containing protein n=1 Tax=Ruficoccus amylovorans TaxID=1804625 RepID=A0A842HHD1_9BACT|nr:fibronectin type III domain-containing protein [Ruficoccus amylovorans]MBC2595933.1 fibronectin type III domain-containing protein [Ruficoccus amylovorans]
MNRLQSPSFFKQFASAAIGCLCLLAALSAQPTSDAKHVLSQGNPQVFEISDNIDFPAYAWPRTLLTYPVTLAKDVDVDVLSLKDLDTGRQLPFQLSDIEQGASGERTAHISFFSELPSGGQRIFELSVAASPIAANKLEHPVIVTKDAGVLEVNAGTLAVRLPDSQTFARHDQVPGPILSLRQKDRWIGHSVLEPGAKSVRSLTTEVVQSGDLFAQIRLSYLFTDGATYTATIKVVSDYDFIEFDESMAGISPSDGVQVEMQWDNFDPDFRFAAGWWKGPTNPNVEWPAIAEPIIRPYVKEDPHWEPGWNEEPSEEMVFRLSPYGGNGVREIPPHISFWEDGPDGEELGVFVLDDEKWNDGTYPIWQPSTLLQVRFRYGPNTPLKAGQDNTLVWTWPLVEGTRSTGIALYDPHTKQPEVENMRQIYLPVQQKGRTSNAIFSVKDMQLRYIQLLRARYGFLCLDKVKDWVLEYPEGQPHPEQIFDEGKIKTPEQFEDFLFRSSFVFYPLGLNTWPGINSIQHRFVYGWVTDAYNRLQSQFTPEQRKRVDALMLAAGYITEGEGMHPIRSALAGAPNMAADGWCVPMQMAYLFPAHPMSQEWRDYYEQSVRLTSRFFTRPEVPGLNSNGGRWTESLGTYNWADLRPLSFSLVAGLLTDGKNRWANPWMASRGQWLVDMLSAPVYNPDPFWRQDFRNQKAPPPISESWEPGDPLDPELGFKRQYPAHGAHGSGTGIEPPSVVWLLGNMMLRYKPMLGEHLLWIDRINQDYENHSGHADWLGVEQKILNWDMQGTPPELTSTKYTGHGIVLRAGVGAPDELSLHMEQVDRGPNYRWGNAGEGASGSLYFFAQGKLFTGHERESAGDRTMDDTDGVTTFGVMKDGAFRSIGMNLLEKPLYDLGVAQFAELTPRKGEGAYSWPEYQSRNVFMVGTDYFILSDEVLSGTESRFTWFTAKDAEFPHLVFLKPMMVRQDHWTEVRTPSSKGFERQFVGSSRVLVTPKDDVEVKNLTAVDLPYLEEPSIKGYRNARGTSLPDGVYQVKTAASDDTVFRNENGVIYQMGRDVFDGKAGVIRHGGDTLEMAMVQSKKIGSNGFMLEVDRPDIGISLISSDPASAQGQFSSPEGGQLQIRGNRLTPSVKFYIDAELVPVKRQGTLLTVDLPAGAHQWELTKDTVQPMRSSIVRTENFSGGADVFWQAGAGTKQIRLEISTDNTQSWQPLVTFDVDAPQGSHRIDGLTNREKVHLRAISLNGQRSAKPSPAYPLYVSDQPLLPPDGLTLDLGNDQVALSWGEVLGASSYRLYRRKQGTEQWTLVQDALSNTCVDVAATGVVQEYPLPGDAENAGRDMSGVTIYEYAISSVNQNGEGPKSISVSSDPRSWLNWWPQTSDLRFRRRSAYWQSPYVPENMVPPAHYPESE